MLFEKVVQDLSRHDLQQLLEEKLMDILAHSIDFSLLEKADKEVLQRIVDDFEIGYISLQEKTTQADQD